MAGTTEAANQLKVEYYRTFDPDNLTAMVIPQLFSASYQDRTTAIQTPLVFRHLLTRRHHMAGERVGLAKEHLRALVDDAPATPSRPTVHREA